MSNCYWLTLLPPRYNLHKCRDGKYWVMHFVSKDDFECEHESATPEEAIGQFLKLSGKGKHVDN